MFHVVGIWCIFLLRDIKAWKHSPERHRSGELLRVLRNEDSASIENDQQKRQARHTEHRELQLTSPMPTQGTFKALVLLVLFPDHQDRIQNLPPVSYYQEMCDGLGTSDVNPVGSIRAYLEQQSQGAYNIECDVRDWKTVSGTETEWANGVRGAYADIQQLFWPALDEVDQEKMVTDGPFWYFDYDVNINDRGSEGDGFFDALLVFHSGYGAEYAEDDCFGTPSDSRIVSQGYGSSSISSTWKSSGGTGNIGVGGFAIASAFEGTCGEVPTGMAVATHEWLHTLGLPDLYDPDRTENSYGGVGRYDLMALPLGYASTSRPGSLSPWSKMQLGWVVEKEVSINGEYNILESKSATEVVVIKDGFPDGEYLIVEHRQPTGFDIDLEVGGMLVWHIDETVANEAKPGFPNHLPGSPDQPGWPENGNHYKVSLVQADGAFDIENRVNDGDTGDFWVDGQVLGPGPEQPNTDSYQNGNIVSTGITIQFRSIGPNGMAVGITGLLPNSDTGTPSASPTEPSSLSHAPSTLPSSPLLADTPSLNPSESFSQTPSLRPSSEPSRSDTPDPTPVPTLPPTSLPTFSPTRFPTPQPTNAPTRLPTPPPTPVPTFGFGGEIVFTTEPPTPAPTFGFGADVVGFSEPPTKLPTPAPTSAPTPILCFSDCTGVSDGAFDNIPTVSPSLSPTTTTTTLFPSTDAPVVPNDRSSSSIPVHENDERVSSSSWILYECGWFRNHLFFILYASWIIVLAI